MRKTEEMMSRSNIPKRMNATLSQKMCCACVCVKVVCFMANHLIHFSRVPTFFDQ